MASEERGLIRRIVLIFDRLRGKQAVKETQDSLRQATDPKGAQANLAKIDKAMQKEVRALKQGFDLRILDNKETQRAAQLQSQLRASLASGNLTLGDRIKATNALRQLDLIVPGQVVQAKKQNTAFQAITRTLKTMAVAAAAYIGVTKAFQFVRDSIRAANDLDDAGRRLSATAKLTGVNLAFLEMTVEDVRQQFGLTAGLATDLTIEVAKLGAKAGDVRRTGEALEAFMDIGAARGLDAVATLRAVRQAVLQIDEGTDKLFNKNPSTLYKEYAAQIGKSAAALTEQEKGLALFDAALRDGEKVRGSYQEWLLSTPGQQFLLSQEVTKTKEAFGKALQPALVAILPWVTKLVSGLTDIINQLRGVQDEIDAMQKLRFEERDLSLEELQQRQSDALAQQFTLATQISQEERRRAAVLDRQSAGQANALILGDRTLDNLRDQLGLLNAQITEREKLISLQRDGIITGEEEEEQHGDTEDALKAEIELLTALFALHRLSADEIGRAFEIEKMLRQAMAQTNLTLQKRLALAQKFADIQSITIPTRQARAGDGSPLAPIGAPDLPVIQTLRDELGRDAFAEQMRRVREEAREAFFGIESAAHSAAFGVSRAFADAFGQIGSDIKDLGDFAGSIFGGLAAAGLQGLAQYASTKVVEKIAQGFDMLSLAKMGAALSLAGFPNGPALAVTAKAAATDAFLAAGKWAAVAGLAQAGASAFSGGFGGGGGAAGASARNRDAGSEFARDVEPQNEVHIHLVGDFDMLDPRVQRVVYGAEQLARERYGDRANVIVHHKR